MKKLSIIALLFALAILVILPSTPVLAIADPDSPPQISAVYVYENCLEDGDCGILIDYYLDYDPVPGIPTETATEAYFAVFVDTDGTTQLRSVAPYTYVDSGYERGLVWIYFTAAEVTTYGISEANKALYKVWLMGNPTIPSGWAGDPPKTTVEIDYWQTSGDTAVLLALRVLYYADVLELIWALDMVEVTALGNRLTSAGESYFENVIQDLRSMAPGAFSTAEMKPTIEDLDYLSSFSATATGVIVGTPVTLADGTNNENTSGAGEIVFELGNGTVGTVTGAVVTGAPLDLVAGTNTVTITGAGAIVVEVELQDTTTAIEDIVVGTGFDLTDLATDFGMSRWMLSGIVWMIMTVIICAAVYRGTPEGRFGSGGTNKIVVIVFDICIVGGMLLGLLKPVVAVGLFLAFGMFTGYMLFFRGAHF